MAAAEGGILLPPGMATLNAESPSSHPFAFALDDQPRLSTYVRHAPMRHFQPNRKG